MKKAVLLVESQPPHLGEYMLLIHHLNQYDFIYVCLNSPPLVLPIENAMAIWDMLVRDYGDKVQVVSVEDDLTQMSPESLPLEFQDCTILTTSQRIFVHLSSMNLPVELIPNVSGYHSIFLRVAYRQGRALDWLRTRGVNSISTNKNN